MKISDKRQRNLYAAISGNIIDLRIEISRADKSGGKVDVDEKLFQLERSIWREVVKALNITEYKGEA